MAMLHGPVRRVGGLATTVVGVSVTFTVLKALLTIFQVVVPDAPARAAAGPGASGHVVAALLFGLASLVGVGGEVAAFVATGLWLVRVRQTAAAIDPAGVRRSPAWCFLGWAVPFVCWWFPKQIIDDSQRVVDLRRMEVEGGAPWARSTGGWWAGWVVGTALAGLGGEMAVFGGTSLAPNPAMVHSAAWLNLVALVVLLGALPLWIAVVRRVTALNDHVVDRITGAVPAAGPPPYVAQTITPEIG